MSSAFIDAVAARRSQYGIAPASPITPDAIIKLVEAMVNHVPSPYNSQTSRVVVLYGEKNEQLWATVKELFIPFLGDDEQAIAVHSQKLAGLAAGFGTILFMEDQDTIKKMQQGFPILADYFQPWSTESSAMLQFAVWTALKTEGLGASLQHHQDIVPGLNEALQAKFDLPAAWKGMALMPFGTPVGPPGNPSRPKDFLPIETRVKVLGTPSA